MDLANQISRGHIPVEAKRAVIDQVDIVRVDASGRRRELRPRRDRTHKRSTRLIEQEHIRHRGVQALEVSNSAVLIVRLIAGREHERVVSTFHHVQARVGRIAQLDSVHDLKDVVAVLMIGVEEEPCFVEINS